MAVFNIIDVKDLKSTDINLFFPVGIPEGHDLVRAGLTLTPKLLAVTPAKGTNGGTLVHATVPGVGTSTTGLDLIMAGGISICQDDVKVVEYGKVSCWTKRDQLDLSAISLT